MDRQPDEDDPRRNSPQEAPAPTPRNPTVENAQMSKQPETVAANQQDAAKELRREFKLFEVLSLVINVLLALIAISALWIYHGQLVVMRGTLAEMQRSGEQSTQQVWRAIDNINWMARSMEASEQQSRAALNANIESSRNDQRAWISAGENMITIDSSGDAKLELFMINTGKTPALDTESAMGWQIRPLTMPTGPPDHPNYRFSPQDAFAPQSRHPFNVTVSFAPYQADIIAGRKSLVFYGTIRYHDIYGINPRHETSWCLAFTPGESAMRFCLRGNKMN